MPNRTMQKNETIVIDAGGKILGRIASEIASVVRGKHRTDFALHTVAPVKVIVRGVEKIRMSGTKLTTKKYYRHSGYLGSLKSKTLAQRLEESPRGVLIDAIRRMLPNNRLRARFLKNISFQKDGIDAAT